MLFHDIHFIIHLQDIIAGLLFGTFLNAILLPLADSSDFFLMSNKYSQILTVFVVLFVVVFYPASDRWSPARYVWYIAQNEKYWNFKVHHDPLFIKSAKKLRKCQNHCIFDLYMFFGF